MINRVPVCLLAALLAIGFAARAQAGQVNHASPLGYWNLDETVSPSNDTSVNGNNLNSSVWPGNVTVFAPPGNGITFTNPRCLAFAPPAGMITVLNNAKLQITGDITIAFWMYPTADATAVVGLVTKGSNTLRNYGVWSTAGATHNIQFQCINSVGGTGFDIATTGAAVGLNAWKHVTCTVSGSTATIYLNGVSSATGPKTGVPATSADPLTFAHSTFLGDYFTGRLDDIRIYDRALSAAEVSFLAAGGGPPTTSPTALSGSAGATGSADLAWTGIVATVPITYSVWRGNFPGGPYTVIGTSTVTSYSDTSAAQATNYYYVVSAVTCAGQAPFSTNEASVATLDLSPKDTAKKTACGSPGLPGSSPTCWIAALLLTLAGLAFRRIGGSARTSP